MNAIVMYESNTGFTKQYAEWIANALSCPCKPVKEASAEMLAGYDTVVFGGWVLGNGVMGLEKLKKLAVPAAVFAVGASEPGEATENAIRSQNALDDTPLYYFEGGFHVEKLNFMYRMMLKMVAGSIAKKEDATDADRHMAEMIKTSCDHTNRETIAPLVNTIKARSAREAQG